MGCGSECSLQCSKTSNNPLNPPKATAKKEAEKMLLKPILTERELFCNTFLMSNSDAIKRNTKEWEKLVKSSRATSVEEGMRNHFAVNPSDFLIRLKHGPPPKYRWTAWKTVLQVSSIRTANTYQSLIAPSKKAEAKWANSIKADVHRTFPDKLATLEPNIKELTIQKLENVLIAVSQYCPEIGYCQGVNYVVCFMLLVSNLQEEEVFWSFVALVSNRLVHDPINVCGIEGLYSERFPQLELLLLGFNAAFEEAEMELKEQFVKIEYPDIIWVHKWIFVLFLLSFQFCYCVRFWDYMIAHGFSGVIKLSLAIVSLTKDKYEGKTFTGCNEVMSSFREGKNLPDVEEIIRVAERMRVTSDMVRKEESEVLESVADEAAVQKTYKFKAARFLLE
eukprot:TRINITY_DN12928_c0_g1_i11.p1 TRINITY_DN12928_c0_g1~~TRINITY_DN12928_c0_g1_i11.p1  ORF type:complete len:392 (-),score=125.90 TRINITY_DN12928_c0_g1_i11:104-1279(-)